jgi:hypothetical protein
MTRQGLGRNILERLITELGDKALVEFRPRQEGNTMHVILAPPKAQPVKKEKPAPPQGAPPSPGTPPSPGAAQGGTPAG